MAQNYNVEVMLSKRVGLINPVVACSKLETTKNVLGIFKKVISIHSFLA